VTPSHDLAGLAEYLSEHYPNLLHSQLEQLWMQAELQNSLHDSELEPIQAVIARLLDFLHKGYTVTSDLAHSPFAQSHSIRGNGMRLVIVESPNKRQTIQSLLQKLYPSVQWLVEASVGHICQLADEGEDNTGIFISERGVSMQYAPNGKRGKEVIQKLKKLAKEAEIVILATDDDREGESISWHLHREILGDRPYERVVYHEITEKGIREAFETKRELNFNLIDSQRTRQAIDRLIGYKVSPVLIQLNRGRSAGRVQSAALRLVASREQQITSFVPVPYWALSTVYQEGFTSRYTGLISAKKAVDTAIDQLRSVGTLADDRRLEFDDASDGTEPDEEVVGRVGSKEDAERLCRVARQSPHTVIEVGGKEVKKSPPPPLTTSAMQQVASVRFGFPSEKTMQVAQSLFEGVELPNGEHHGVITYHRTDSVSLSGEFCESVRAWLLKQNRGCLIPEKVPVYRDKKGAQGAHEAIRPVDVALTPEVMESYLSAEQLRLYSLIWNRAIASQCKPAVLEKTQILIQAGQTLWQLRGTLLQSAGYTYYWKNVGEDVELPILNVGQQLNVKSVSHAEKKTQPPSRFTEAKLIQSLERLGIGRPSTYASIMQTLRNRQYLAEKNKVLMPTKVGLETDTALQEYFPELIQPEFTSRMEESLDRIAAGEMPWERYLSQFYFKYLIPALVRAGQAVRDSYQKSDVPCPKCNQLLVQLPSKWKNAPKPYYLRCMESSCDAVLVWNVGLENWVLWQKGAERAVKKPEPGKLTDYCCQVCGGPLGEHEFSLEGKTKKLLKCSVNPNRPDHQKEVYFQSGFGGFWNPHSQKEPSTEQSKKAAKSTSGKPATKTGKPKVVSKR